MGKVLFISNYFETTGLRMGEGETYLSPLGILSIATFLEQSGHECHVVDLNADAVSIDDIYKFIENEKPNLIAITAYTENVNIVLKLSKNIKKMLPTTKIVVGGPHATLDPHYCLKGKYVDFVSIREGESTLLELIEAIDSEEKTIKFRDIKSIIYLEDRVKKETIVRGNIENLDLLPVTKRRYIKAKRKSFMNISSSRGCPGRCIYCSATALSGAKYRVRSVEDVYLECIYLTYYEPESVKNIYIVDDTFTAMTGRIKGFTKYIITFGNKFSWRCESRVDVMNEELIKMMSESGCADIQFGIESGSQEVLDKIKKRISLEKAVEVMDMTYRNHIPITASFMLGHFSDTKETMTETRELIKKLRFKYGDMISMAISYNTPFPGTWQYDNMSKLGMRFVKNRFEDMTLIEPIIETDNFTVNDLRQFYYECSQYTRIDQDKIN